MKKDDYIDRIIREGDKGSAYLAARCAPTLRNSPFVEVIAEGMNGLAVIRPDVGYEVVVHVAGGDPRIQTRWAYANSMVERLYDQAKLIGATPVAFANIIDSSTEDLAVIEELADGMVGAANRRSLAIVNGEWAILGKRVRDANMTGAMVSIRKAEGKGSYIFEQNGVVYGVFNSEGKAIYLNADGVGTKTDFYERLGAYERGVVDLEAMLLDDASKRAADVQYLAALVETRGVIPFNRINSLAQQEAKRLGIRTILAEEDVGKRIRGYAANVASYNMSGVAVSIIDEERLAHPLIPQEGNALIAIRGKPNPRSNGITSKRETLAQMGRGWSDAVDEWHETPEGKYFLEFVAEPSTVLYPVFRELIADNLATGVFHLSGGAYEGKLAKPLAKYGLFATVQNMFAPDPREQALAEAAGLSPEVAHAKWPMGTDGFVATSDEAAALRIIKKAGLEGRVVSRLERGARSGIELHTAGGAVINY